MEHFTRFRRNKKDAGAITGVDAKLAGMKTPPPGEASPPQRPTQKLRAFLRSSGKRARASPPASLPISPTTAVLSYDGVIDHPPTPVSSKKDVKPAPQIPNFLNLSAQEIDAKFQEIVWLERNRMMQSVTNPSPDFRWARMSGARVRALDRYVNIQPWRNNRIKLQVPNGHFDYINASPIVLRSASSSRPPDRYIAMQGPKKASTDHVWRMVVEQLVSPGVIVMLTETHESDVEKCFQYFPRQVTDPPLEVNERDEFGDGFRASVRCAAIEETPAGAAIELRKLVVRVHGSPGAIAHSNSNGSGVATPPESQDSQDSDAIMLSPSRTVADQAAPYPSQNQIEETNGAAAGAAEDERIVWHFLYKKWPDFGVPALEDLESFFTLMRLSREKNAGADNPRIVHCSAGVGRSGTFIALEHLMRELDAGVLEHYDSAPDPPSPTAGDGRNAPANSDNSALAENGDHQQQPAVTAPLDGEDLIFNTVNQLREQRRTMVQADSQYLFIYQVLRKLWQDKYGVAEEGEPAAKRLEVDPFVEG